MKTSELLSLAMGVVENGWHQGSATDGLGNYCIDAALGSIARVEQDWKGYARAREAMCLRIRETTGHPNPNYDVRMFNDARDTTKLDVLNIFEKTIIGLEEVGA